MRPLNCDAAGKARLYEGFARPLEQSVVVYEDFAGTRFKSQILLNQNAILAAIAYVDLDQCGRKWWVA